jgi:hypothetical protein
MRPALAHFAAFQCSFQAECKGDRCFEGSKKVEQFADRGEINKMLDR